MARRKRTTRAKAKTILPLPDLEQSKNAVLNSLAAATSQESYGYAIDEFTSWYCSEPLGLQLYRCPSLSIPSRTEEPGAFDDQRALSGCEATRTRGS
jgi:hypothetical protein